MTYHRSRVLKLPFHAHASLISPISELSPNVTGLPSHSLDDEDVFVVQAFFKNLVQAFFKNFSSKHSHRYGHPQYRNTENLVQAFFKNYTPSSIKFSTPAPLSITISTQQHIKNKRNPNDTIGCGGLRERRRTSEIQLPSTVAIKKLNGSSVEEKSAVPTSRKKVGDVVVEEKHQLVLRKSKSANHI
ncbi:hypothetical protein L2E82_14660 [Cichorium intybus]|uniref:Uncharacterized protein n=1 Tax=Cichorium intybus TaxID=13427 RepID=A0ACB9F028_CICIN|nr:hypothetical protein L2E82_14660 [Cichorium intybus]